MTSCDEIRTKRKVMTKIMANNEQPKREGFKTAGRTIWNFCTTGFMPAIIIAFVAGTALVVAYFIK